MLIVGPGFIVNSFSLAFVTATGQKNSQVRILSLKEREIVCTNVHAHTLAAEEGLDCCAHFSTGPP